jgi:hypothetical protein
MTWLTVMEYLCHKWPRICSICRKHFPVLSSFTTYYRVCNYINTTGATSGAGTAYPSGASDFTSGFSGVRVTRSLVLYECFIGRCLSFCTFSFGHCVACSSSIYGFWLPLWYLQTLLPINAVTDVRGQKHKCQNYFFINMWRKNVFDIHFTEFGAVMTTVLPILFKYCYKYCYSDSRKLWAVMKGGGGLAL